MLSTSKEEFRQNVKKCIEESVEKGLCDAMLAAFGEDTTEGITTEVTNMRKKMSKEFAKKGKETISDKLVDGLVDAIDTYIRSIGIQITTSVPGTLACSVGPVSGIINISPNDVKIL